MTRRARRALALVVVLLGAGAAGYVLVRNGGEGAHAASAGRERVVDTSAVAPEGVRIQVEVLNASTVRGLARRATGHLRDMGYDVVSSGNAGERHDSTVVLVRRGGREWAERIARAMGEGARVEERPDSLRYVDVTVLVGGHWRPPPGPFRP